VRFFFRQGSWINESEIQFRYLQPD
jgi:hypothetical protein